MATDTASLREMMEQHWLETGQEWLRENGLPWYELEVQLRAHGFELDPAEVGPSRRRYQDDFTGIYLTTIDPETCEDKETVAVFPDIPEAAAFAGAVLARHPQVQRVQVWQAGDCVWAAHRAG